MTRRLLGILGSAVFAAATAMAQDPPPAPAQDSATEEEQVKREEVVGVRREGTFLRYTANARALEDLLQFLFAECCTRCCVVNPAHLVPHTDTEKTS